MKLQLRAMVYDTLVIWHHTVLPYLQPVTNEHTAPYPSQRPIVDLPPDPGWTKGLLN